MDFGTWEFGRDLDLDSGVLDVDFEDMERGLGLYLDFVGKNLDADFGVVEHGRELRETLNLNFGGHETWTWALRGL